MFNSQARYLYNLFKIIFRVITLLISLPLLILFFLNIFEISRIIPPNLYLDINNPWMRLLTNTLFFGTLWSALGFLYLISEIILKKKCMKLYANECKEIIDSTVLPKNPPKVLYIYTTHNDLIESRVLQNMKQSYKNFEVWVSDGSSDKEWRKKIKDFCNKNKINLYQLESKASKNKADNINQFLKNYKGDYDYLLIGDADEVFHENFVEYSIKIFLSNKIKNLSYIAPLNINYRSKGIYPNTTRLLETFIFYWILFARCFTQSSIPPLSGQSCLISKQSLIECNQEEKFDDGNLEDWYLESEMVEKINYGIMLPNAPCYFEPDVNVKAHFNRIMRINDWRIRWWKIRPKNIIKNYSEKYSNWYQTYLTHLTTPIIIFLSLFIFSITVWLISNYWDYAFKNNTLFWISVGTNVGLGLILLTINLTLNFVITKKLIFNFWDNLLFPFIFILWSFASNIKVCIHWFNSLFLGKYSQFGGSGKSRFFKGKSGMHKWWISLFIFSLILLSFNLPMFLLTDWEKFRLLIIIFNVYIGSLWLGIFSYLILWYINFIPYNSSFKREDWIKTKKCF